eukprot:symbB.v1.2.031089.t2/scaffold3571.1/size58269/2
MTDEDLLGLCRTYRIHYGLELFCDASETRRSREDRLLRYDSLKEGWLSAEELRKLMLEVRSTSDAGQIFLERRQTCLDSGQNSSVYQCMPSLEALKIFDSKVPGKEVFRICERKGLACTRTKTQSKACRVCGTRVRSKLRGFCRNCDKTEIDKQSMAMKILYVFGGGLTETTGRDSGFGSCEKAEDCWMPQTECAGEEGSKYCLCKVGTCFSMVRNVSNFGDDTDLFPVCQAKPNSWREIAADLKRSFLTYRYSLGQMAGRIKSLPRQIDDTICQLDHYLSDVYHEVDCTRIALDPRFKNMEGSIGAVYYNFPHAGAAWVDLQPGQGHVTGFYDSHPIVNWRHENLMRLFFRNLRYFVKPRGLVKIASNMGAVGVRFSYILGSAEQNEFQHVETLPFLEWSLHRYGRAYGDRRDKKKRPGDGQGYNAQKAESDMVYTFEYRPSGKDLPPQEIKLPPTFQTIVGCNDGPFKNLDRNSSMQLARQLHERFIKEVSGTHVG